ncbi:MAG: hypothetical protein CMF62_06415 [Magnetococcales bacterium]|nr:hypothetical protein [Magnetococcales bacterium]|tara:strand:- start:311174 stop:311509 length:336 start_codon:yes stop_codon:yes gene_type:complete
MSNDKRPTSWDQIEAHYKGQAKTDAQRKAEQDRKQSEALKAVQAFARLFAEDNEDAQIVLKALKDRTIMKPGLPANAPSAEMVAQGMLVREGENNLVRWLLVNIEEGKKLL